jgi:hypothetical protein
MSPTARLMIKGQDTCHRGRLKRRTIGSLAEQTCVLNVVRHGVEVLG